MQKVKVFKKKKRKKFLKKEFYMGCAKDCGLESNQVFFQNYECFKIVNGKIPYNIKPFRKYVVSKNKPTKASFE